MTETVVRRTGSRERQAVGWLPEREEYAITRYFWGHRTYAQIGAELGVSESRVLQLLVQAKARLREFLESPGAVAG